MRPSASIHDSVSSAADRDSGASDASDDDLRRRLAELEQELQDGDITEKGYIKRRSKLLVAYRSSVAGVAPGTVLSPVDETETDGVSLGNYYPLHEYSFDGAENQDRDLLAKLDDESERSYPPPLARKELPQVQQPHQEKRERQDSQQHHYPPPQQQPRQRLSYEPLSPVTAAAAIPAQSYDQTPAYGTDGGYSQPREYSPSQQMHEQQQQYPPPRQSFDAHHNQQQPVRGPAPADVQQPVFDEPVEQEYDGPQQQDYQGRPSYEQHYDGLDVDRQNTLASTNGYFAGFTGQNVRMAEAATEDDFADGVPPPDGRSVMLPLEPREIPFAVQDPHDSSKPMSGFDSIGAVLRYRAKKNGRAAAFAVLDVKGKEVSSLSWEKAWSRSEKVAQVMRDKSNLYRGDRVALVYREHEMADFAIALLGCFLAGVVAVPVREPDDYGQLTGILSSTQAHLALTTETTLKGVARDISARRVKWPAGVEWWKTNEFGGFHSGDEISNPTTTAPTDLAYIDFARAPTGDIRGVVLSHRTIMHQMAVLQAVVQTVPAPDETAVGPDGMPITALSSGREGGGEIVLSYLDPRAGVGLVLSVLFTVYGGHRSVWLPPGTVDVPGQYAHVVSKSRATVMVADYAGLKRTVYNYQQDPMATRSFKKGSEPNFGNLKLCLVDCLAVDPDFDGLLADRWLRPLRSGRARAAVAPMLTLPEHGGMIVSVRDWLGGEERMGCHVAVEQDDYENKTDNQREYHGLLGGGMTVGRRKQRSGADLAEVLVERDGLSRNELVIVASGDDVAKKQDQMKVTGGPATVRVGGFGFPIADATLALVDPETSELCAPGTIGEIWVDSPSLSGGFWALPRHTDAIFHARPVDPQTGSTLDLEFLRTGLLGFIVDGKIFVLGLYEDRIRQQETEPSVTAKVEMSITPSPRRHRFFFVQHLVQTLIKTLPRIYDCSAFDTEVNGQYLPVIVIETQAASTAPTTAGGPPRQLDIFFLESLAERVMGLLAQEHGLRVYCVMATAPNRLPRMVKNGHRTVGNMLCRRDFEAGSLACVHVKFAVEQSVGSVPCGVDMAGVWTASATAARVRMLAGHPAQFSGADFGPAGVDERTAVPMDRFGSIADLLQLRANRQADELAICPVDGRGKEGKTVSWRKFDQKVAAVAAMMKSKVKPPLRPGEAVLLMYSHSADFAYALYACMLIGVTAVPIGPVDQNRLAEDGPALVHIVADWNVRLMLVNSAVEAVLKLKPVGSHLKRTAHVLNLDLPSTLCTSKAGKSSGGTAAAGLKVSDTNAVALVALHWTADQRRIAVKFDHPALLACCQAMRDTCRMPAGRPLVGCVRSAAGLGFIHSWLLGVFLASPTYIVSPVDFAGNPSLLVQTLGRYRVRDSYATAHMLEHIIAHSTPATALADPSAGQGVAPVPPGPGTSALSDLRNLMVLLDGRSPATLLPRVTSALGPRGLSAGALAPVYSHPLNPVITARSYIGIAPVSVVLDRAALRRGMIVMLPDDLPGLVLYDSGIVAASTQVCIVNPDSGRLSRAGEYGEIWVASPANGTGFYRSTDPLDSGRVGAMLAVDEGDAVADRRYSRFVRTGDLGFLHTVERPVGPEGAMVAMQLLFVLCGVGETFDVHGLHHFPAHIEASVEACHRNIVSGGAAVFQAGGLIVVLVEVSRRNYLAGIVPVIVNTVLNEHQFVIDIVAFVGPGDFPRSRLGDKQRGKILGGWVAGKRLKVIAQFAIVDSALDVMDQLRIVPDMTGGSAGMTSITGEMGGVGSTSTGPAALTVMVTDEHGRPGTAGSVGSIGRGKGEMMRDMPEPRERFARLDLNM